MTKQEYQPDEIEFLYSLGNLAYVSLQNSYLVAQQLEKQRLDNPAARALPLLECLANEVPAEVKIPYLSGAALLIKVIPCS